MITRFPTRLQTVQPSAAPELRLVSGENSSAEAPLHEDDFAWVHWMFQSARLRHGSLVFASKAKTRHELLSDWRNYTERVWLPHFVPCMLRCWQASLEKHDAVLAEAATVLNLSLDLVVATRSIEAGRWLLSSTQGAKYQGSLGRFRQQVAEGLVEPHLPIVWAAVAALFQLPAPVLLSAVLREEWRAGCPDGLPHAEPQGSLSFGGLTAVALRSSFSLKAAG